MMPFALPTIDRVIGVRFLLVAAIGQAAAANCDTSSCVTLQDGIANFAPSQPFEAFKTEPGPALRRGLSGGS